MMKSCLEKFLNVSINYEYLVKTLREHGTFEDLILHELELQEYKEYAKRSKLLLEI